MKLTIKIILTLFIVFFYTHSFSQKTLELKNSDLERVSPDGKFWWWNDVTRKGADATFSVEDFDTNPGSQKDLKLQTLRLGEKGSRNMEPLQHLLRNFTFYTLNIKIHS